MKKRIWLVLAINFLWSPLLLSKTDDCTIRLTGKLVQDILDNINIIRPQITAILEIVININSASDNCCSKIGDLNMDGTCLDSQIDVPDDINDLNLTVIQLLKTILLELRGCSPC